VLLTVLGVFGGIGILVYLAAWLIIPAEGDTASPVEAMLGRGRSSMSPVTVILLGVLLALMFGFVVTDGFRAALLGSAILVGGALLLNRNGVGTGPPAAPWGGPDPAAPPGFPAPSPAHPAPPVPGYPAPPVPGYPAPPAVGYPAPPVGYPAPAPPLAGTAPATRSFDLGAAPAAGLGSAPVGGLTPPGPPTAPLPGGYRQPFAPHGPYASGNAYPPPSYPVAGPPAPRPPKPPRERSRLGSATFSLVFVAIGLVAVLDLLGAVPVRPSTYFAAALVTIAIGLLVGAWYGRARWLIPLGVLASLGLGLAAAGENWNVARAGDDVQWQPAGIGSLADRYETTVGDATLDLRKVDFTGQTRQVTVKVRLGTVEVAVPPGVDVTSRVTLRNGEAEVFGQIWNGVDQPAREFADPGTDAPGDDGKLRLLIELDAGHVEVHR
jgi:hypothetical protein